MDSDPIDKGPNVAKLEHGGSHHPGTLSKFGGQYSSSEMSKTGYQEEIKSTQGNVFVRLKGISEDYTSLQLSITFKDGNNEVKFFYNLTNDTPEGILNEMRQANFDITPVDFENIRHQIKKCVSEAIDKIRKLDSYKNGMPGQPKDLAVTKNLSEGSHSSAPDPQHHSKSQTVTHEQNQRMTEYQKTLETAQYAINRFISNIDKEIQLI